MDEKMRYSDEETAHILRLAAGMELPAPARPAGDGLTLLEVAEIAEEAGIARENVVRAAALVASAPSRGLGRALWSPTRFQSERAFAGELSEAAEMALVEEFRRDTDEIGQIARSPGLLEWAAKAGDGTVQLALRRENGRTRIVGTANRASEAEQVLSGYAVAGAVAGSLAGAAVGLDPAALLTLFGAATAGGAGLGLARWRSRSEAWRLRLESLVSRLALQGESAAREGGGST